MGVINWKNGLVTLGLLVTGVSSMAQSATVTFSGTVKASTCSLSVNSTTGATATVTLPAYSSNTLAAAAGTTSPSTSFTMGVSGCSGTAVTPLLYMSATNVTSYNSNSYITSGITGVAFELLDSTSTRINVSTTPTLVTTLSSVSTATPSATATYYVRYVSTSTSITAGSSTAGATLTVSLYYS